MRRTPGNIRFGEVDALSEVRRICDLFNQRGSHRSYHHEDGRLITIVSSSWSPKTCHPADMPQIAEQFSENDQQRIMGDRGFVFKIEYEPRRTGIFRHLCRLFGNQHIAAITLAERFSHACEALGFAPGDACRNSVNASETLAPHSCRGTAAAVLNVSSHFRASYTKCPISGTMSFSIASCTAAIEPGIVSMTTLLSTPPTARLSIAAGPMSS